MMLLDTHILLSALGQVDLVLPNEVQVALQKKIHSAVSVASIWEIAIKQRTGKLRLTIAMENLLKLIAQQNIEMIDITVAHTLADIGPEPLTKDPFDRLLLGVCATESMKLLTIDRALADHPLAWREKQEVQS